MRNYKKLLTLAILFCASFMLNAQKIGVVDTEYILNRMPQYKESKDRLDKQIKEWQEEIQELKAEYDLKKTAFENEKVLLVGEQLKQREKEVSDLDKKIKNIINKRFGTDGEINELRAKLVKPFQNQIWDAIKIVSEKNTLGIVLDKSNSISVIFLENKYDYTDKVLALLVKNDTGQTNKKK